MSHKALFSALLASLIGSCLLTGCANQSWFERFYKPASASHASPNHLEKDYALSEAMPKAPICGPIREALVGSESPEMLPTTVPGLYSDF